MGKENLLNRLSALGYDWSPDTISNRHSFIVERYWKDSTGQISPDIPYYKLDTLIIDEDTLTNIQFALEEQSEHKTKVWINGMDLPKDIPNDQVDRKLRVYYKKLIKRHLRQSNKLESNQ